MSVKKRIEQIAREVATGVANSIADQKLRQINNSSSPVAKVVKVDGTTLTVELADGSQQTVQSSGSRVLGVDSVGIIAGGVFM